MAREGVSLHAGSFLLAVLLLNACGLTTEYITINYHPQKNVNKIEGADRVGVGVQASDQRANKENVGKKGYEYKFLAPIKAKNDLAESIANAVGTELTNRGFSVNGGSVLVFLELSKFYNSFQHGDAVAEVIMNAQVRKSDGGIIFSRLISGEATEGIAFRSGKNAKSALESALRNAVQYLDNDTEFITALFEAAKP